MFAVVFMPQYKQTDDMDFSSVDSKNGHKVKALYMQLSFLILSSDRGIMKFMDVIEMGIY